MILKTIPSQRPLYLILNGYPWSYFNNLAKGYRPEHSILIVLQIMDRPLPSMISRNNSNNEFYTQTNTSTPDPYVTINEQIILTKDQFELLKIISNAHNKSISEYIQKALIETLKTEIEFGVFCDILLDKLDPERELT